MSLAQGCAGKSEDCVSRMSAPSELRLFIRTAIKSARFPQNSQIAEDIVCRAIELVRNHRKYPTASYNEASKVTRQNHGTSRALGRKSEQEQRFLIFSALFRAWYLGFEVKPKINNRYGKTTPFVAFAEPILMHEGIGKTIAHSEEYQSYRKRILSELK